MRGGTLGCQLALEKICPSKARAHLVQACVCSAAGEASLACYRSASPGVQIAHVALLKSHRSPLAPHPRLPCPRAATLFVVGSYHIGKERAYLGAAHQLGWRVHCGPAKRRLLRLLGLPQEWLALLTDSAEEAQVGTAGPLGCAMPCRAAHHVFCFFDAALRGRAGEVPRSCFP